ncbi:extracellular solute-binding protein [Actinopolymorpha singaporensis]|uniref:Putative aldouronate transport system substrate-binding protein n=1 Tax=Actinopolymorpha singaporensis TaxID=117157 RepID=A0A1H1WRR1_9ACTN|nr:extracellular solute-binding protein [Actinopolymorpha singaporensis]SDS99958.1 putative aldouronate transport system substrate-binding protein [Actinopolymorpha singaporensis]
MAVDERPEASPLAGPEHSQGSSRRQFVTRAVGVGLSAAAAGPVLAACSSGGDGGSKDAAVKDPLAAKGGPKTTPNPDVIYPEGYVGPRASKKAMLVKEKVTLRVVVPQNVSVGDWAKNDYTKWYEKTTNVAIKWQVVAGGDDAMTKVNAMIASGDIPDVFMNINFTNAQQLLYGSQGLFVPLNKLIDEYTVETKRIFKDYPDAKSLLTSTDGNIYSMPYVNDCFHCNCGNQRMWIYKPWLDKLGLDMPQTLDEFEAVLKAFKDRDPNGNGKRDEVPLMSSKDDALDTYFMSPFMYNPGEPWLVLNDGKVDVTFNKPEWREGLRYMNKLYKQGLLARQSFTQDGDQLRRVGDHKGEPILGATRTWYWGSFATLNDDDPKARWRDYVAVPIPKGPDGQRHATWNYYGAVTGGAFVVTKACKNPAVAVQWADGQYELESIMRAYSGDLDKGWRWAKKGEVGINGKQAVWTTLGTWPPPDGQWWGQLGLGYRSNDYRLGEVADPKNPTFEKPLYEESKQAYYADKIDKSVQLPPLYLDEEQAAQTGELSLTLSNYVKQSLSKFVLGQWNVDDDAAWKNYLSTLERMGTPQYVDINQKAYEAKYK